MSLHSRWCLEELAELCTAETSAEMLSVIYSQFGPTKEEGDSNIKQNNTTMSPDSPEMEINDPHIEDTTDKHSPTHVSSSPDIIDVSQSSDDSPLSCNSSSFTFCTGLIDQEVVIESSPNPLEHEASFILPILDLTPNHVQNSDNIINIIEVSSRQSDPDDKKSPLSPFCVSLSSTASVEFLEHHSNSTLLANCDSDDLFTSSPSSPQSKNTLLPQTKSNHDIVKLSSSCSTNLIGDQSVVLEPDISKIGQETVTEMFSESIMRGYFSQPSSVVRTTPADKNLLSQQSHGREKLGSTFLTPLGVGQFRFETDEDITPMPDYRGMVTPALKERCSKFGVRPLPKRKMIAKLEEIYDYTHPLVGERVCIEC